MTSSPRSARRAIPAAAFVCITALVAGCSATSGPSAAPSGVAAVTATSGAPANTGAAKGAAVAPVTAGAHTPALAAPPVAPAGAAPCPTRYLQAKVGVSQGTTASTYTVIDFTNISHTACTLYGYPGVSLAGGKPVSQVGLAAAESTTTPRKLITLAPGATGNALLQIVHAANYPASQCHPLTAQYLQIFPPNQTTPIYLSFTAPACSSPVRLLTVSVIQPGSGSSA